MAATIQQDTWTVMSETKLMQHFPLHRACRDGDSVSLSNLLKQSSTIAHLNLEDTYYGWTPSHWAAYFGKLDCLRMLVMGGLVVSNTAADLRTSKFNQTPSHIAAFAGHPHCLQWLIQAGADANAKDYLGETALHKAARTGSFECVSFLVATGSDVGSKNNNNQTASDLAQVSGNPNIVTYLSNHLTKDLSTPYVSVGGYYGFEPKHVTNGKQDCEMEMDPADDHWATLLNKHLNGAKNLPELNGDVTLDVGISQNKVAIGGKKRSREETITAPEMKRMRMEGPEKPSPVTYTQPTVLQPTNNNKDLNQSMNCSFNDHYQSVIVEKGYDALNFQMMMNDSHGC